jgi:hypothetical protein
MTFQGTRPTTLFTREKAKLLGLDGCNIDTFSLEYDEFVEEFGREFDAHGA